MRASTIVAAAAVIPSALAWGAAGEYALQARGATADHLSAHERSHLATAIPPDLNTIALCTTSLSLIQAMRLSLLLPKFIFIPWYAKSSALFCPRTPSVTSLQ